MINFRMSDIHCDYQIISKFVGEQIDDGNMRTVYGGTQNGTSFHD